MSTATMTSTEETRKCETTTKENKKRGKKIKTPGSSGAEKAKKETRSCSVSPEAREMQRRPPLLYRDDGTT